MERNIVQIGNVIKPVPRRNWEAAASQMHAAGDDKLIIPDVLEDEKLEEMFVL